MTEPQALTEAALAASAADGCVVVTEEHSAVNLRWAANSLTTNGQMRSRSMTVIATFERAEGTSAGVVTRVVSNLDEVEDLVRAADQIGRAAQPARDAAPLVGPDAAPLVRPDAKDPGWDDAGWAADAVSADIGVFADFASALGAGMRRWRPAEQLLYGFAEHQLTSSFVASSTGLRRRFDQPDGRLEVNGKSADLTGSVWAAVHTNDFTDVDVEAVLDGLTQRLAWSRTRLDLPPGRYETILPPSAVADLLLEAYFAASARDAEEGRSVFAATEASGTRLGEVLSTLPLTLRSDPDEPGLRCPPFEIVTASDGGTRSVFDNGAPVTAASWIADGRLAELVRSRAWAARTGEHARPYVGNLILSADGANASLADMIARTERGLLLTCVWYVREVDPQTLLLTGLTRDGVYLIEDGQVRGAVNNFRFNESPVDLLGRITEVGRTEHTLPREWRDYFSRTAMPAIRVPDFNMSTVSPAS